MALADILSQISPVLGELLKTPQRIGPQATKGVGKGRINISDLAPLVTGVRPTQPSLAEAQRRAVVGELVGNLGSKLTAAGAGNRPRQFAQPSRRATDLVADFEGFVDTARRDLSGTQNVIGFGSSRLNGVPVQLGTRISEGQARQQLGTDVNQASQFVDRLVQVPLSDNEKTALISLVQNVGVGNFAKSKALAALNAGDKATFLKEAFDPEIGFVRGGGQLLRELQRRRAKERDIFLGVA